MVRVIGEDQVVAEADRLVRNTDTEARELVELYGADPARIVTIPPGVDLARFRPGDQAAARRALGVPPDAVVLAFAGRIQPLKAPDVLLHAAAALLDRAPDLRSRLVVLVAGGPSGSGLAEPTALQELAGRLGLDHVVRFLPPQAADGLVEVFRAADVVAVPATTSRSGWWPWRRRPAGRPSSRRGWAGCRSRWPTAGRGSSSTGTGRSSGRTRWRRWRWTRPVARRCPPGAVAHARRFSWDRTTDALLSTYTQAAVEFAGRAGLPAAVAVS